MSLSQDGEKPSITLFTIGSNEKSAEQFFTLLTGNGVRRVVDVRLKNNSALLGFARQAHLPFLLRKIAQIDYVHMPLLAPDEAILADWKLSAAAKKAGKKRITWLEYERRFTRLLRKRKVETLVTPAEVDRACLLCSEVTVEHCHRRLTAEYLRDRWADRVHVETVQL